MKDKQITPVSVFVIDELLLIAPAQKEQNWEFCFLVEFSKQFVTICA
jgi:hypothetical protein